MTMAANESEEPILVTFNKKVDRDPLRSVFLIIAGLSLGTRHLIYIRMQMEPGVRIVPMHSARRHVRLIAMLRVVIVRSQESRKNHDQMNECEQRCRNHQLVPQELHRTRIRGSAA